MLDRRVVFRLDEVLHFEFWLGASLLAPNVLAVWTVVSSLGTCVVGLHPDRRTTRQIKVRAFGISTGSQMAKSVRQIFNRYM